MEFSEFASGLLPFCIGQMKKEQYFNEIVGNFIQDAAMDSCPVLHKKADTKYRFLKVLVKSNPQMRVIFTPIVTRKSSLIGLPIEPKNVIPMML